VSDTRLSPTADARDVDATMQAVRLQLFRENIGALDLLEPAHAAHPDPRYAEQAAKIRGWLSHLGSREAYLAAQEEQYRGCAGARDQAAGEARPDPARPQDEEDGRAPWAQSRLRRAGARDRRIVKPAELTFLFGLGLSRPIESNFSCTAAKSSSFSDSPHGLASSLPKLRRRTKEDRALRVSGLARNARNTDDAQVGASDVAGEEALPRSRRGIGVHCVPPCVR